MASVSEPRKFFHLIPQSGQFSLTIIFPWLFPDSSLTVNIIPGISPTCFKFPDISRFSRQVVTLDNMGLSSFKFFWWAVGFVKRIFSARVRFSHSRSSKVIDIFTVNQKRVCNFLLVCHSNHGPILHRFRDIAGFLPPSLFHPDLRVFHCSCWIRSPMLGSARE